MNPLLQIQAFVRNAGMRQMPIPPQLTMRHGLGLAALMIGVHLAISLLTNAASACGVRPSRLGISLPRSSSCLRVSLSSRALPSAAFNFATIAGGVPLGANKAFHAEA